MGLLRRLRRKRILKKDPSPEFAFGLSAVRHLRTLDPDHRERVEADARVFAAEKHWEGCGGLKVSDGMKAVVSALACLLVADNRSTLFENTSSVLLYPSGYSAPQQTGPAGIVTNGSARLGEAHVNGPVVLSWSDTLRHATQPTGRNVVLHEFAHKLDMANGPVDGTPVMESAEQAREWHEAMTSARDRLVQDLRIGLNPPLRPYALTNPAEFFAVGTEVFFERPHAMHGWDADLYRAFARWYRQDPMARESALGDEPD